MKDITLVMVDTTETKEVSKRTIEHCQNIFPCAEAILFTDIPLDTSVTNVTNIEIKSHKGFSAFMLSNIVDYINTSHYLYMQPDGYILNPSGWDNTYLLYDYIGAPWPHHPLHDVPPHPICGPKTSVGNGGFSLRSTKLGKLVKKEFIRMSKTYKDFIYPNWKLEDAYISRDIRPYLEEEGCVFAPEDIAGKFSCENKIYVDQFGFHGKVTMQVNSIKFK